MSKILILVSLFFSLVFILEVFVILISSLVYVATLYVLWYESISPNEGLALAVFAPVFTLMLFYGRTMAGRVLGIVGPAFAYSAFYYPPR